MATLRSHDQGFVAAPVDHVFGTLDDPSTYPQWWRGSKDGPEGLTTPLAGRSAPATRERRREGLGLFLVFARGSLEWYLEPFEEGTIVNAILEVEVPGFRASRRLMRMRGDVRDGLVGLKGQLEVAR